jgi:hypothetical protein
MSAGLSGLPKDILEFVPSIPPGYMPNVNLGAPAERIGGIKPSLD